MLFYVQECERISAHIAAVAARSTLLKNRIRQAKEQVIVISAAFGCDRVLLSKLSCRHSVIS